MPRKLRLGAMGSREVVEFLLMTGRALNVVMFDDVGDQALVLGVAHQTACLFQIGPVGIVPVMRLSRRAVEAVAIGAFRG